MLVAFLLAGWMSQEMAWWKFLSEALVGQTGKESFDGAGRFALRIVPLRSG